MAERMYENAYRTTMICVDSYENKIMKGSFYNPYLERSESFCGLLELLVKLESMLDRMRFPDSSTIIRRFGKGGEPVNAQEKKEKPKAGSKATFSLKILFRQNSSWQGTLTWHENRVDQNFRSVLEMALLMDDALNA